MTIHVGFLLGREPGANSVMGKIQERLRLHEVESSLHVLADDRLIPHELLGADVVGLRALDLEALKAASALERAGVRCCNTVSSTRVARDKRKAHRALSSAGLPVPQMFVAESWREVTARAAKDGVVVKAIDGSRGSGVSIIERHGAPEIPPFAPPYVVQERIDHDGLDRKLYVVGDRVAGILRRWPATSSKEKLGVKFAPCLHLRGLALSAARVVGLEICGIDVVEGARGPAIVDINAFPGFKGVPEAATWIACHLLETAQEEARRCA
jgi:ribosomal protein S6--L-glutamate ligase